MGSQSIPTFDDFSKQELVAVPPELVKTQLEALKAPLEVPSFDEFEKTEVNPGLLKEFGTATIDQLIGMAKGVGSTAWGLNEMLHKYIPGISWATNKLSDYTLGQHLSPEEFAKARDTLNLKPKNFAQKVGFGAEQFAEFLVPGGQITKAQKLASAGTRFAEAFPRLAKLAPSVELAAKGSLEAAPMMTIAKVQGQENTGGLGMMAMTGPTFSKLLNKTGATAAASGVAKGITGKVSQTIAEKIPEVTQSPRQMMWRALKPNVRNRDFDKALDSAMPELYTQAKMTGKKAVENVDDFLALVKSTKKRIWAPYEKFLGATKATVDGTKIADTIETSVVARQALKDPAGAAAVKKWADTYRAKGKMPLSEAEDFLQNANAELQSFYVKYPAARHASMEADTALASTVKEAEALRKGIGEQIANAHPKVKEVYGALSNLEAEAYRRVNVSKRLAPESLTEQMSKVHAAGKFALGVVSGHPLHAVGALAEGIAYREAGKAIAKRNTSDYLIKKAFKDFGEYVDKARRGYRIPTAAVGASRSYP